jgi:hypothetical protein
MCFTKATDKHMFVCFPYAAKTSISMETKASDHQGLFLVGAWILWLAATSTS